MFSFSLVNYQNTDKTTGPPFLLVSRHPTSHRRVQRTADGQLDTEEVRVEEVKCIDFEPTHNNTTTVKKKKINLHCYLGQQATLCGVSSQPIT